MSNDTRIALKIWTEQITRNHINDIDRQRIHLDYLLYAIFNVAERDFGESPEQLYPVWTDDKTLYYVNFSLHDGSPLPDDCQVSTSMEITEDNYDQEIDRRSFILSVVKRAVRNSEAQFLLDVQKFANGELAHLQPWMHVVDVKELQDFNRRVKDTGHIGTWIKRYD